MEKIPLLLIAGKNEVRTEELSIQLEPSLSLISSLIHLFRRQGQFRQAADLCRLGLEYYPDHNGLRVLSATCRLDLGQPEAAQSEMQALAVDLQPLAPSLREWGELARKNGLEAISDWALLLAQILDKFPEEKAPAEVEASPPSPAPDALVVPTLKRWLAQLQQTE
jgi:tetratricopeptide (TPR) repeat protein